MLEFLPVKPVVMPQTSAVDMSSLHMKHKVSEAMKISENPRDVIAALTHTPEEVRIIEENTREQSSDPTWHMLRKGRITASNFHGVMRRKKEGGALADRILNGDRMGDNIPAALEWGRKKKKTALREYGRVEKVKHRKVNVRQSGFVVMPDRAYDSARRTPGYHVI